MNIDWSATGSMLSGSATWAGALAVVYAARTGANSFDLWRRQKIEERRIEVAERILSLAYRLADDAQAIVSRGYFGHEYDDAEKKLDNEQDGWRMFDDAKQKRMRSAQAYMQRLVRHESEFKEVWTLKPTALAVFGKSVEAGLHAFWLAFVDLTATAEELADQNGPDDQETVTLRRRMFSGHDNSALATVASSVERLEEILLPIIRSEIGKQTER